MVQPFEFEFDYSPVWLHVGQYMRWAPQLEDLADQYVRNSLGIEDSDKTPPVRDVANVVLVWSLMTVQWIAIHMRHGDFANWCRDVPKLDCFAPLSVIARRVEEVKQDLLERKGLVVNHVIMTSDENNATWWEDVVAQGWFRVDHSKTIELYGAW